MQIYRYNGKCNIAGARIRERRKDLGLSQEELAARIQLLGLDITQRAVSRVETGVRVVPDYELQFYAAALNCPVSQLLGLDGEVQRNLA